MPRIPTGQLDLHAVFRGVQDKMLSELSIGRMFEHHPTAGAVSEHHWIELLAAYLPKRYRATPAFILNSRGKISQQIDIAIYDQMHSPTLYPHAAAVHLPIESVCAVFEVKTLFSKEFFRDAGEKVASVRALTRRPILAGMLATSTVWQPPALRVNLKRTLDNLPDRHAINFGCALAHGAFETKPCLTVSPASESLIFFTLHLIHRLNQLRPAKARGLLAYLRRNP